MDVEQHSQFHPVDTGTYDVPPGWKGNGGAASAYDDTFMQDPYAYSGWERFPDDAAYGCGVEGLWQQAAPTVIYDSWQGGYQVDDSWSADQGQMLGYPPAYAAEFGENIYLHGQETTVPVSMLSPVPGEPSPPWEGQKRPKRKRQGSGGDARAHDDYDDDTSTNSDKTSNRDNHSPGTTTSPAATDETTPPLDKADEDPSSMTPRIRDEIARGKNRLSTRKCRNRKRIETTNLTCNEQTLEDINTSLTICARELAEEVRSLKMQLLRHANCESEMIQDYIKLEAKRIVQKSWRRKSSSVGMSPCDGFVGGMTPGLTPGLSPNWSPGLTPGLSPNFEWARMGGSF